MASVPVKTKRPSGVKIARKGSNFVVTWKICDKDYGGGQDFQYRINGSSWHSVAVSAGQTQKTLTINFNNFFPASGKSFLKSLDVRIRGRRKAYTESKKVKKKTVKTTYVPVDSDWTYKTFAFKVPKKAPKVTATLSSDYSNVCTFAWTVKTSDTSTQVFRDTEYQTMLVKNCKETNGAKLSWKSSKPGWATGTRGASGSLTITEDSASLASASWTRWVRVRSRGSRGVTATKASQWTYGYHTYSIPYQAKITYSEVKEVAAGGYLCTIKWSASASIARPIDKAVVEYAIAVPDIGMTCPDSASWTGAKTLRDTAGQDGTAFSIDSVVGYDQCLFVRVNTYHDTEITYGLAKMVDVGRLTAPADLSVSTNDETYRAVVTASNESEVLDSFLAVKYMTEQDPNGFIIGIIPNGDTSVTVQCPHWQSASRIRFAVYAVVGSYTATVRADGVTSYAVKASMTSVTEEQGGSIPQAPAHVSLDRTDVPGTIRVTFDWSWSEADNAELSWADHADAWTSTDEPETFVINNMHASQWNISGLETGITWYVRVRLSSGSGDNETFGAYSDIASIDLSSAPAVPILALSEGVIVEGGSVTASWDYVSGDGTGQSFAEVAEVAIVAGETVYTQVAQTESAQYVTITAPGWQAGESHLLAVRTTSTSGKQSPWSDPVPVIVAEPLTASITQTSLVEKTLVEDGFSRTVEVLEALPLTLTVTGAGDGGTTTVVIERAQDYQMERPDESNTIGYEGETIVLFTQVGEAQIEIAQDSEFLFGYLDDGAAYRIIATVQDGLGQSAEAEEIEFEVRWTHQALVPDAKAVSDYENMVAIITPVAPDGVGVGDVCDIYRLSVDKPELIYPNASFGTRYVDPFPTLGEYGGHRVVYKTVNGDYITADNKIAWVDLGTMDGDYFDTPFNIIDYGAGRVQLQYNIDLQNTWKKDFKETKYLGGSVQGDWNPAVSRTGSISSVVIADSDQETIENMRRLAVHAGICHVRTKDGSSYPADVQVSESYQYSNGHKLVEFSLTITRVDPETYDGMTYDEWRRTQEG